MTSHLRLPAVIGLTLLLMVIVLYAFARRSQAPEQIFSATINRDCAPWDGSAFTVSIPMKNANISISVYQAPDIHAPTVFSFPDDTMSSGSAFLILPLDSPEPLKGKVSFQRVQQGNPVQGTFDLATEVDKKFKGKFIAEWGNEVIYCG